jgi:hypothetical protein
MSVKTVAEFCAELEAMEYDRIVLREIARTDPVARFQFMGRHIQKRARKLRRRLTAVSNRIARFQALRTPTKAPDHG